MRIGIHELALACHRSFDYCAGNISHVRQHVAIEWLGMRVDSKLPIVFCDADQTITCCGTKVFWLVIEVGRMFRLDREHHPKDLEALMHSLQLGRACCLFVRCLRVRRARRAETRQALRGPSDSQT